jgi:hypothetical protein
MDLRVHKMLGIPGVGSQQLSASEEELCPMELDVNIRSVYDIESLVQWPDPRQRGHTASLNKDLEILYDEAEQGSNWTSPNLRNY